MVRGGLRAQPVRVFADNGRWWVLNIAPTTQREVEVCLVSGAERQVVDELSARELESMDQCSAPVPDDLPGPRARDLDDVIGDCGVYEHGRRRPGRVPLQDARGVARTTSGFVWIGLQQPTSHEFARVADYLIAKHAS